MIKADKYNCTGCFACYSACPAKCIEMSYDDDGFLQPRVDSEKCLKCNMCNKVCPALSKDAQSENTEAFAVVNKDEGIREQSSSGGMFTALASYVLERDGVVFGAAFDEEFDVKHVEITSPDELHRLRGSKYVQSRIGDILRKAKEYLDGGRLVYFSGTPCQISGLLKYLGKDYDNLITQDIVCHGVPSPAVFEEYKKYREEKAGSKITYFSFRKKKKGAEGYFVYVEFENGTVYEAPASKDEYTKMYLRNICLRNSCYNCNHKSKNRPSDFTLADFWGVEKLLPEMSADKDKGVSLVLVNSDKARRILGEISPQLVVMETNLGSAIGYNKSAISSSAFQWERKSFVRYVKKHGFEKAYGKYSKGTLFGKAHRLLRKIIKHTNIRGAK